MSRTLELLDRGPGGSEPFIDAGFKALAVNIVAKDGELMGRVTMDSVNSPYPFGLMLPQSETERLLEERLAGLGVTVERQVEVLGYKRMDAGVEVTLRHPDGQQEVVAAEWLLGCDGAHSVVRHSLGVPFVGETMDSDWMLADIHMTGYPFPDSEPSVYWHIWDGSEHAGRQRHRSALRRRAGAARRVAQGRAGQSHLRAWPQRCRQDQPARRACRPAYGDARHHHLGRPRHHRAAAAPAPAAGFPMCRRAAKSSRC